MNRYITGPAFLCLVLAGSVYAGQTNHDQVTLGVAPEITGSNGETLSNTTDGTWALGTANLTMTGNATITGNISASGTFSAAGTTFTGNVALDDGVTDSPSLAFTDAQNDSVTLLKVNGAFVSATADSATGGINILTGNLKVGNGTPDTSLDGEDAYIEGTLEVDGILNLDGAMIAASIADFSGRVTTTDGVASGTVRVVGGRAFNQTAASTAVSATSTETDFDQTYTIPADTLKAGTVVKIRTQGIATATNSTDTLQIKIYFGSTVLVTTVAVDAVNNDVWFADIDVVIRTVGGSGTFVAMSHYQDNDALTTAQKWAFTPSTVVDTTSTVIVKASATWSTTSASNSCRQDILIVEVI